MTVGKGKRPCDPNQLAKWIVDRSTNEVEGAKLSQLQYPPDLSAYMAAMGRRGGKVGSGAWKIW